MAIQFDSNAFRAYNNLGIVLRVQGNLDAAIDHYQMALKLYPDFPEAFNNLGSAYREGLDESTDWGTQYIIPDIELLQQQNTWDIGAYITFKADEVEQ